MKNVLNTSTIDMDRIASDYGLTRMQGETDNLFRTRLKHMLMVSNYNHHYAKLCLVLNRLGIRAARNYLPAGVI